jgi:hypothetical protein
LIIALLLGIVLTLVHAHHITAVGHDGEMMTGMGGWTSQAMAGPETVRTKGGMDCPAPRWWGTPITSFEPALAQVVALPVDLSQLAAISWMPTTAPRLPVARGPDAHAVLQRFTL